MAYSSKLIFICVVFNIMVLTTVAQNCNKLNCINGECREVAGVLTCFCKIGFVGNECNITDPCAANKNPCIAGTCYPFLIQNAEPTYFCSCFSGYSGKNCQFGSSDPCQPNPCLNDGQCKPDERYPGRFTCNCPSGYTGLTCGIYDNICDNNKCGDNGICYPNMANTNYTCACEAGFTGFYCEEEIIECASDPCKNNGTCIDVIDGYFCRCPNNYAGLLCETYVNPCQSNPCASNAKCNLTADGGSYFCQCQDGFYGEFCKPNPCNSNPCNNKAPGACIPLSNNELVCTGPGLSSTIPLPLPQYTCICANGFPSYASINC